MTAREVSFKVYFTYSLISAGWVSSSSPEMIIPFSFTLPVNLAKHPKMLEIKTKTKGRRSINFRHKLNECSTYVSKSRVTVSRDIEQEFLISVALYKLEITQIIID